MHSLFYSGERLGKGGKPFQIKKIRTLINHNVAYNQEEVISSRKFLKKFGLDEIPQIINIILGDMSFVGVRPMDKETLEKCGVSFTERYIRNKPGFLGPHALCAYKGEEYDYNKHSDAFMRLQYAKRNDSLGKSIKFVLFLIHQSCMQVISGHEDIRER